jgi:hypothetical protein
MQASVAAGSSLGHLQPVPVEATQLLDSSVSETVFRSSAQANRKYRPGAIVDGIVNGGIARRRVPR